MIGNGGSGNHGIGAGEQRNQSADVVNFDCGGQQAGDLIAGCRLAVAFPDQPRHGSPPAGDHHFLPGFHRIEEGGEPRLGLRQIDAAHDQITVV